MSSISGLIEVVEVSFTCPKCDKRGKFPLSYVPAQWSKAKKKAGVTSWCRCKSCEKVIELSYRIRKTEKGAFVLRTFSCVSDGKNYKNKRYVIESNRNA